jgi:uncharacterized protein DUF6933
MLVLRCTQRLLKRSPGPTQQRQDALVPALGDWHANLIRLAKSPIVLCVNDISLLVILVPGRDFPNFVSAFQNRLAGRLGRMGLATETISAERAAMEIVQIQPSNSRSVLASMNDFVRHLKWRARNYFDFSEADALEDMLSETPMGALKYQYAVEVAAAAFRHAAFRADGS